MSTNYTHTIQSIEITEKWRAELPTTKKAATKNFLCSVVFQRISDKNKVMRPIFRCVARAFALFPSMKIMEKSFFFKYYIRNDGYIHREPMYKMRARARATNTRGGDLDSTSKIHFERIAQITLCLLMHQLYSVWYAFFHTLSRSCVFEQGIFQFSFPSLHVIYGTSKKIFFVAFRCYKKAFL